jgi:antagonist of KipI
MSIQVQRGGLLTTVQDLGRHGLQHLGIVPCGAMDPVSHRLANALVGNPQSVATLECTVLGPEIAFLRDALIALYGGSFDVRIGDEAFPANRPVFVKRGTVLTIGKANRGARAYLAIAGGFKAPEVLGSRSTYLPASFGGLAGRALKPGDVFAGADNLPAISEQRFARVARKGMITKKQFRSVRWSAPELTLPFDRAFAVRAMEGRHWDQFDAGSQDAFFGETWRVSPDSNRMGYRLAGPRLSRAKAVEILSEPTCLGTVQVPNDGTPIALMADHQTTGGYPKIAEIAGADIPGLAQLAPGGSVRFVRATLEEAHAARREARERFRQVEQAIAWEFGRT